MASKIELILNGIVKTHLLNGLTTPLFKPSINACRTFSLTRSLSRNNMFGLITKNEVFRRNIRVPLHND